MGLPRFYVPASAWSTTETLTLLSPEDAHHAKDVLRLAVGDAVQLFDGEGRSAQATVGTLTKSQVGVALQDPTTSPPPPSRLVLAQAIPKGKTMEWIVEKAVELGAAEVIPLLTQRTVVRLDAAEAKQKQAKWQRVAIEACKQCGQNWLPHIQLPQSLEVFLKSPPKNQEIRIVAALTPDARSISEVVSAWTVKPATCTVFVGPEGDFTPQELALLLANQATPVTLGPIVLRAETAALFCLSVFQYELGR